MNILIAPLYNNKINFIQISSSSNIDMKIIEHTFAIKSNLVVWFILMLKNYISKSYPQIQMHPIWINVIILFQFNIIINIIYSNIIRSKLINGILNVYIILIDWLKKW